MTQQEAQYVYERLKALGDHNSLKDLNGLRFGYRRAAREHEQIAKNIIKAWSGYPEHYYQEDLQRHKESAANFMDLAKAVERVIGERKADQRAVGVSS